MTHRNYLAGMTPTHFRGLPFDVWNTLIAEVGCSFRFVVLNATVFDCHIFDRPLSTQFLAISKSHLINLVQMKCSLHSRHFTSTQDWFHDRPLLNLYSVIVLVQGTNPPNCHPKPKNRITLLDFVGPHGVYSSLHLVGDEQLVAHPVTTKPSNNDICTVFAFLTSLAHAGVPITKQAILQILSMTALKTWRKKEGEGKAVGDEDLIAVVNNAHAHLLIM
ncbi:hypothetical protein BLNAU_19418 [Blattamonas nauphoetae]|uniref:Uncharacterized protein n=1 Tax=Blattamonas nauphoetae TaxID=2049346 RepID=A0ABQ9X2V3_9EUKA|nr:hypothetical protein BLNAU_19418 [Blattamonas nauphoetae]